MDVVLNLPEELVKQARAEGLLENARVETWIRRELSRKESITALKEDIRRLRAVEPTLTQEEIDAEIENYHIEERLEYYLNLPYKILITPDEEGFGIEMVELPGCFSHALGWEDIASQVYDAKFSWIASSLKHNDPIPEPIE